MFTSRPANRLTKSGVKMRMNPANTTSTDVQVHCTGREVGVDREVSDGGHVESVARGIQRLV